LDRRSDPLVIARRQPAVRWWSTKIRQFGSHVRARIHPAELADVAEWLTRDQLRLFDSMHVADQRHGLDVVATLRTSGVSDPEVLLAGLLHDAGKGRTGVVPRVVYSLGEVYGHRIWRAARLVPPMRAPMERLIGHAETSARLAHGAGCSLRTVALVRHQEAPVDREFGELLRLADEAN
jgi:hypothetical protein